MRRSRRSTRARRPPGRSWPSTRAPSRPSPRRTSPRRSRPATSSSTAPASSTRRPARSRTGSSRSRRSSRPRQVLLIDPAAIEAEIRGKPLAEAQAILDGYGRAELSVWPDWVGTIPTLDARVDVRAAGGGRPMTGLLGIDLGERRIGVAIADGPDVGARPLVTLRRGRSIDTDVAALGSAHRRRTRSTSWSSACRSMRPATRARRPRRRAHGSMTSAPGSARGSRSRCATSG